MKGLGARLRFLLPEFARKRRNEVLWRDGKESELDFWRSFLATSGSDWPDDYRRRLDPDEPLEGSLTRHLDSAAPDVSLLDVGAGPLTVLGKRWPGHQVSITAVDALAQDYDHLLMQAGVWPLVRTQPCESERLLSRFNPDTFDLVHARNTLDHSYDPVCAIRQMVDVTRPGGIIITAHHTNEAVRANYHGFHLWNFDAEGGEPIIWNPAAKYRLCSALRRPVEVVEFTCTHNWHWLVMRKLPPRT